jgi:hypothetical protein
MGKIITLNLKGYDPNRGPVVGLEDLHDEPLWVWWKEVDGRKLPMSPKTGEVFGQKPELCGTYAEAKKRGGKKVGITLGRRVNGLILCGVDLDRCLNGDTVEPIPMEVVERLATYTEVSPSEQGLHLLFLMSPKDAEGLRNKTFSRGEHREIAFFCEKRKYFTVTGDVFKAAPLRHVPLRDAQWVLDDVGPRYEEKGDGATKKRSDDVDRSKVAIAFMCEKVRGKKRTDALYQEVCKAILDDTGRAGDWARDKGVKGRDRELRRTWEKAWELVTKPQDTGPIKLLSDLQDIEFGPVKWLVNGLIPGEGLTLLVGPPKLGKSILVAGLAVAVQTGGKLLDEPCRKGDVLYLALEDNDRRLKSRFKMILDQEDFPPIQYHTKWPRLDEGGLERIEGWLTQHPKARVVIIDILQSVRSTKYSNASRYEIDYNGISALQKIAMDRRVAMIVVHHDRKMRSEDPFDLVSGTQGLVGAADTGIIMTRQRWGASLFIRGRDIEEEIDIGMTLNPLTLQWHFLGTSEECRFSDQRRKIIKALVEPMTAHEVAAVIGEKYGATRKTMFRMVQKGQLKQRGNRKYERPS